MTEKRFYVAESKLIDGYCVFDREKKYVFSPRPRMADCLNDAHTLNELAEENIELHIQLDFLKDENQHMRYLVNNNEQLQERNNRQAKQLDKLYTLIEKQDWKTLKGIIQEFQECEEQLQKEWGTYVDE